MKFVHYFNVVGFVLAVFAATMSFEAVVEEEIERHGLRGARAVFAQDCQEHFNNGYRQSGRYCIKPDWSETEFEVYCEMDDGGGWTVIQRRCDGSENFNLGWEDYKKGFGKVEKEFWLGLEKIHRMTNNVRQELRIEFTASDGKEFYAMYNLFIINGEEDRYRLETVGHIYVGNLVYPTLDVQVGNRFSTNDRDNDDWDTYDCAEQHKAGWWFGWGAELTGSGYLCQIGDGACTMSHVTTGRCVRCTLTNLNGVYGSITPGNGIFWSGLRGTEDCGLTSTEMRIRPARDNLK